MAFCTYCGQAFQRNEHLERHLATHANIKRFKCETCHLSFSRRDVLQRHVAVHGESGVSSSQTPGQPPQAGVRHRTQEACRNCARTKTKCDASTPCNRCRARGLHCDRKPKRSRVAAAEERPPPETEPAQDERITPPAMALEAKDASATGEEHYDHEAERAEPVPAPSPAVSQAPPPLDAELAVMHNAVIDSVMSGWFDSYVDGIPRTSASNMSTMSNINSDNTAHSLVMSAQPEGHWADASSHHNTASETILESTISLPGADSDMWPDSAQLPSQPSEWKPVLPGPVASLDCMDATVEHRVIIEAYQYWASFQCNPVVNITQCPRTAGVLLESLSHMPEADKFWGWLGLDFPSPDPFGPITSMPLRETVRDKLAAISQSLLQKALWVHQLDPAAASYPSPGEDNTGAPEAGVPGSGSGLGASGSTFRGFLILPPSATLEHFLREYMRIFEPFYPILPCGMLDANTLLNGAQDNIATLLILLMIGQGAISDPTSEARRLSGGLTEVCRISLFDTVEKDVPSCHHHLLLHCSLVFAVQAAWSGDKWLMDIGLGQRGIYIAIIRNSRLLDAADDDGEDPRQQSREQRERLSKVVYAWVVADLELSLFHGIAPHIQMAEVNLALPSPAGPGFDGIPNLSASPSSQPSLRQLFRDFLAGRLTTQEGRASLTPVMLRLLLHPLHTMVHSQRQLMSCFDDAPQPRSYFSPITKRSVNVRMEEVQTLLHRWYDLYQECLGDEHARLEQQQQQTGGPNSFRGYLMLAALLTYHTIYLNMVTGFAEIERLARSKNPFASSSALPEEDRRCLADQCIQSTTEAVWHAGQMLRILYALDHKVRPPWWPVALYRATLTLWAASVFCGLRWKNMVVPVPIVPIDVDDSHGDLAKLIPALTDRRPDAERLVRLDDPSRTVETCLLAFGAGVTTRFSEGIHAKLTQFAARWYGECT